MNGEAGRDVSGPGVLHVAMWRGDRVERVARGGSQHPGMFHVERASVHGIEVAMRREQGVRAGEIDARRCAKGIGCEAATRRVRIRLQMARAGSDRGHDCQRGMARENTRPAGMEGQLYRLGKST